jgi:hypothetical protein
MPRNFFTGGLLALSLAGCTDLYEPKPVSTALPGGTILSSPASMSQTFYTNGSEQPFFCTEPPPDAAFGQSSSSDISLSLVSVGGSDSGDEAESSAEVEMVGRTPAVLLAREMFFRTCELSRNFDLSKDEALNLFRETLAVVGEGWKVEGANTTVKVSETENIAVSDAVSEHESTRTSSSSGGSHTTSSSGVAHTTTTSTTTSPTGHHTTTHTHTHSAPGTTGPRTR